MIKWLDVLFCKGPEGDAAQMRFLLIRNVTNLSITFAISICGVALISEEEDDSKLLYLGKTPKLE